MERTENMSQTLRRVSPETYDDVAEVVETLAGPNTPPPAWVIADTTKTHVVWCPLCSMTHQHPFDQMGVQPAGCDAKRRYQVIVPAGPLRDVVLYALGTRCKRDRYDCWTTCGRHRHVLRSGERVEAAVTPPLYTSTKRTLASTETVEGYLSFEEGQALLREMAADGLVRPGWDE